jgi:hypothetical protein
MKERMKMDKLVIEDNVSDPKLFVYDETELKDKKAYRQGKAEKNLKDRLNRINKETGQQFNIDPALNDFETIKQVIFKKLASEEEYRDMWLIVADRSIQGIERNMDKLKKDIDQARVQQVVKNKLIIPGQA